MEIQAGTENFSDLQELNDPEFFARWAVVRNQFALAPPGSPEHHEVKRRYDAVVSEYRRRMGGGRSSDR